MNPATRLVAKEWREKAESEALQRTKTAGKKVKPVRKFRVQGVNIVADVRILEKLFASVLIAIEGNRDTFATLTDNVWRRNKVAKRRECAGSVAALNLGTAHNNHDWIKILECHKREKTPNEN